MGIVINGQTGIDAGHLPISNAGNTEIEGTLTAQGQNVSPFSGFKNYIINGNFDVWQRGTSFAGLTNASYSADRWVVYDSVGNINYNVVRNAGVFTGGYGTSYTWNSGTGVRSVIQFIENVTKFKVGTQVTISFEAYTTSTPYTVGVAIQGVMGVWAALTNEVTSNIALTNTKTKYSVTLPIPDWTSLGIDWAHLEDTKLALKFNLGAETNGRDFILGSVQLEEGSVATPFENRPYGLELSLCQRYANKFLCNEAFGFVNNPTTTVTVHIPISTTMRASGIFPNIGSLTLLKTSFTSGEYSLLIGETWINASGISIANWSVGNNTLRVALTGFTGLTTGSAVSLNGVQALLLLNQEL